MFSVVIVTPFLGTRRFFLNEKEAMDYYTSCIKNYTCEDTRKVFTKFYGGMYVKIFLLTSESIVANQTIQNGNKPISKGKAGLLIFDDDSYEIYIYADEEEAKFFGGEKAEIFAIPDNHSSIDELQKILTSRKVPVESFGKLEVANA